jgi:hypothetical protein
MSINLWTVAEFVWGFGRELYLKTNNGSFIWSDPRLGGDNTIRPTKLSYQDWINPDCIGACGKNKGVHIIGDYCGNNVVFLKGE